jgi:MoxR-like ATPase
LDRAVSDDAVAAPGTGTGAKGGGSSERGWAVPAGGPGEVREALARFGYLADDGLATVVYLSLVMRRPLLLEGDAGVGKTEVAKVLARWTGGELLRIQCYEGIDVGQAVYEWDYSRQLLHLRAAETRAVTAGGGVPPNVEDELYSERFLVRRPLLAAITADPSGPPPVLLIDEVDRADDEFEAFLLEVLSEYAVTVPELGTFRAAVPPVVVITSNRTRDLHDALKRRCLYHWVEHPDFEREVEIIGLRAPVVSRALARQVAAAVEQLRAMSLYKPPGVAETIDWAEALATLGLTRLDEAGVEATLGTVLKYREDAERARGAGIQEIVQAASRRAS